MFFSSFTKIIEIVNKITEMMIACLMFVMSGVIILQVIRRYIFHSSFTWPEELASFLMVWVVFLGSSVALYRSEHIGLTVFIDRWFSKYKTAIKLLTYLVLFLSLLLLTKSAWNVTLVNLSNRSISMGFSLFWPRLALPLGFLLMLLNTVYLMIQTITTSREEGISE